MPSDALSVAGRSFNARELALVRQLLRQYAGLSRHELAATVCELLQWQRPSGRLKIRECRDLLERLAELDSLALPAKRAAGRPAGTTPSANEPKPPAAERVLETTLQALAPLRLALADTPERRQEARDLLARYHYLGCRTPFGAHLRYLVYSDGPQPQTLGVLQYSSPAWRMRERDRWIGWDEPTRQHNLQLLVNQSRFLLLPTLRVPNLASHVLALSLRRLAEDWHQLYAVRPLLVETLVDAQRYAGTCYRAANWLAVGTTSGRGRMDRDHRRHGDSPKLIFLYPLAPNARQLLLTSPGSERSA